MHLFEPRDMWASHMDASRRELALRLEDDDKGYTWLTWRDRRVALADVNIPGDVDVIGAHRRRLRQDLPAEVDYDELTAPYSAPADRLRLSAPELDRAWAAFADHGITPVFHVANQRRVFDDAWYGEDDDAVISLVSSIFIWTPAALALTDLALNGVLERHPGLRIGVMELSAVWVPLFLLMLDGGYDFMSGFNVAPIKPPAERPCDYLR